MAEPQKVWNKHKITAIVIMLIAIAIIIPSCIESNYLAFNTPESLGRSISKCIDGSDVHVKVVQIEQREDVLFVSFTDERYPDFMGIAKFRAEANYLWQPDHITCGNKPSIDSLLYTEENKIKLIIYGIDSDPRIASIKCERDTQESFFDQRVTEPNFMEFYEIDSHWYTLRFFDADGNDITWELLKGYDISGPEAGWGSTMSSLSMFGIYLFYFIAALCIALYIWTRNPNPIRYYDENAGKKEKEAHKGLANKWKNLTVRKQAASIILIVSVLTVVILYSTTFSISLPEDNLTKVIEDYTRDVTGTVEDITILKTEEDGNHLFVLYKTDTPYFISLAYLERGLNGRWRMTGRNCQMGMCISSFENQYYDGKDHVIIVGMECDPRAVSYEVVYEHPYNKEKEPIIVYSNNVTEQNFIHIYETGNYWQTRLRIYDANGENIEPELSEKYLEAWMHWGKSIGGPEGESMKSIFIIIIIINLIAFWAAWIEKPKQRT